MAGNNRISRMQARSIAALLTCPSVPGAAKKAGVAERSLYRWLSRDDFQAAYRKERRKVVNHAVASIQAGMSEAVQTLRNVMEDSESPASSKVSAARAILDFGLKSAELEDLAERVEALEKQAEAIGKS